MISTLNSASVKVAEKSGATYEGIARNRLFLHDTALDAHLFSFVPADFPDG
jgi:RimJ/RimL family protein N-acetyltransferase